MVHPRPAQPGLLNGVLGIAHAAQDPVGHRDQQAPMLVEDAGRVKWALARSTLAHLASSSLGRIRDSAPCPQDEPRPWIRDIPCTGTPCSTNVPGLTPSCAHGDDLAHRKAGVSMAYAFVSGRPVKNSRMCTASFAGWSSGISV